MRSRDGWKRYPQQSKQGLWDPKEPAAYDVQAMPLCWAGLALSARIRQLGESH